MENKNAFALSLWEVNGLHKRFHGFGTSAEALKCLKKRCTFQ